jgi:hypothetical protein
MHSNMHHHVSLLKMLREKISNCLGNTSKIKKSGHATHFQVAPAKLEIFYEKLNSIMFIRPLEWTGTELPTQLLTNI